MRRIVFIFLCSYLIFFSFCIVNTRSIKIIDNNIKQVAKYDDKITSDIIGKIIIEDEFETNIVQTTNNTYYLDHDSLKNENKIGSIFIDYRNKLSDKNLLIYGHNSKTLDPPFKRLEKYLDYNFYKEHSFIKLFLKDKQYTYQIFSVVITKEGDYEHTKVDFDDGSYLEHLNYLKSESIYDTNVEVNKKDYIITLQTCNYNPVNTYILIIAKRVNEN